MRRFALLIAAAALIASIPATAQKLELKPYGFVKGDAIFALNGVLSFGSPVISAPQLASGDDTGSIGFTAQHTRFGLKGEIGEDVKAGGLVELDFFTNSMATNYQPRMRLAYAWIATEGFELRIGQQWDLLSANNPMTNNTNGNLWFGGNLGFRRGMIQASYKIPEESIMPMVQLALCEGSDISTLDNWSKMPMIQGRVSGKIDKKYAVGVSIMTASFSPLPDSSDMNFGSMGFGADVNLPLDDLFTLHGEFSSGTNLNNARFFTIAGPGAKDMDSKNTAFWVNVLSKVHKRVHVIVGLGMDKNDTDDKYIASGKVLSNMVIYGNLTFPFAHGFSLALEAMNITTEYKTLIPGQGAEMVSGSNKHSAMVVNLSGKVNF